MTSCQWIGDAEPATSLWASVTLLFLVRGGTMCLSPNSNPATLNLSWNERSGFFLCTKYPPGLVNSI